MIETTYLDMLYCPHMVKGRNHQKVSFEQWTLKGFKILIKCGFKVIFIIANFFVCRDTAMEPR